MRLEIVGTILRCYGWTLNEQSPSFRTQKASSRLVFPAQYRRAVFVERVDIVLREVCLEIEKRYELKFLEIGAGPSHLDKTPPIFSLLRRWGK